MSNFKIYCRILICVLVTFLVSCSAKQKTETLLFVGSFTEKQPGDGIQVYLFDTETGRTELKHTVKDVINTSFLKLSFNGKFLYSVVESQMDYNGKVAVYKIDSINKTLKHINSQDCGGRNPVHLEIDKNDKHLVCSNYSDPSLSVFDLNADGSIKPYHQLLVFRDSSILKNHQKTAHIHSSNFSPDQKFLFAQDLGADKIRTFEFSEIDNQYKLVSKDNVAVAPGSGPRHFDFHPKGKYGYGVAELSGEVNAYAYKKEMLSLIDTKETYKKEQPIYRTADIHISKEGKFLYVSNRGPEEDTIAVFEINENTGKLSFIERVPTFGEHPRNFVIDPTGNFLLVGNQFTNNIVIFRINKKTGKLKKLPNEIKSKGVSSLQMRTYKK